MSNFKRKTSPAHMSKRGRSNSGHTSRAHASPKNVQAVVDGNGTPNNVRSKFTSASRLFLYGLGKSTTSEDLISVFSPYGEVSDLYVPEGKSFAIVPMDLPENARRAMEELQGSSLKGCTLNIRIATSKCALWVGDIPRSFDNQSLKEALQPFGDLESAVVASDQRGNSMGYAHVIYRSKNHADRALKAMEDCLVVAGPALRPLHGKKLQYPDMTVGCPRRPMRPGEVRPLQSGVIAPGSWEHQLAVKWAELRNQYIAEKAALKKVFEMKEMELEAINKDVIRRQRDSEATLRVAQERQSELAKEREMLEFHRQQALVLEQRLSGNRAARPQPLVQVEQPHLSPPPSRSPGIVPNARPWTGFQRPGPADGPSPSRQSAGRPMPQHQPAPQHRASRRPGNPGQPQQHGHQAAPFRGPDPAGPYTRGPHPDGPHIRGPRPDGPHMRGPRPAGPQGRGPHPDGPHIRGPRPDGPHIRGPRPASPRSRGGRSNGPFRRY